MVMNNRARQSSSHTHHQYHAHQGSGEVLMAIGSGLGIEPRHYDNYGELDAISNHDTGGGGGGHQGLSALSAFAPGSVPYLSPLPLTLPLLIEPPGAADSMGPRLFPPALSTSGYSTSSHPESSIEGSWMDTTTGGHHHHHHHHNYTFGADSVLTHSPSPTPLGSPLTGNGGFVFGRGPGSISSSSNGSGSGTGSFPVTPTIAFGTHASTVMSPYGNRANTPDTMSMDSSMDLSMDWTHTAQQSSPTYTNTHTQFLPPSPCPSPSAPSTPPPPAAAAHMEMGAFGGFHLGSQLPQHTHGFTEDPGVAPHSRHHSKSHLEVPDKPYAATRRYSDPQQLPSASSYRAGTPHPFSSASHHHQQQQQQQQQLVNSPSPILASRRQSLPAATARGRTAPVPLSTGPKRKGVRTKKLPEETRVQARKTRNERTMCLGCRLSKVKVSILFCPMSC
jgi:hypothetical protein